MTLVGASATRIKSACSEPLAGRRRSLALDRSIHSVHEMSDHPSRASPRTWLAARTKRSRRKAGTANAAFEARAAQNWEDDGGRVGSEWLLGGSGSADVPRRCGDHDQAPSDQ